jgi:hypothetical protein
VLLWLLLLLLLPSCLACQHRALTSHQWGLQHGWTPLHWAARNGHLEVVEQLLAAGAVADATNEVRPAASVQGVVLGVTGLET